MQVEKNIDEVCEVPIESNNSSNEEIKRKYRQGGITAFQALVNLLKGMVGPGCLSLPLAFKQSGLWAGFALMLVFGFVTYYSFKKIVLCSQHLARKHGLHSLDYGEMAEESFKHSFQSIRRISTAIRYFVNCCLFLMQMGICTVFVVFIKEHLKETINYKFPRNEFRDWSLYLIVVAALCLLVLIRNIRIISLVSLTGNVLMVTSLVIILQMLIRSDHIINELPSFESLKGLVLAAGSILYAYEGQAMILPLENKMKHPHQMLGVCGVLSVGCTTVTIAYWACGFFGYITYGIHVQGSIALNLPDAPLYLWTKVLLAVVVYTSYLIQQFVIVDMAYPAIRHLLEKRKIRPIFSIYFGEAIFKVGLVLLSYVIAISLKDLDSIISLVGVTAGMLLALVIPAIVHTTTFLPDWLEERKYFTIAYHMFWNILFATSGIFFLIMGIISNVQNIIKAHSSHSTTASTVSTQLA